MIAVGAAGLLAPMYAIYVEKIGGDILTATNAWALFSITGGILIILIGRLTDRVKEPEYFIVAGFLTAAVGYLGYLTVKGPGHLFIVQAILGVAMALMTPAHDALYTQHLDGGRFASEWGFWEGMWLITEAIAAFVGGIVVTYFGFQALFILMATMSLLTGFYILFLPRQIL